MISPFWRVCLRATAVWVGASAAAAAAVALTLPAVRRPLPLPFDQLLVRASEWALLACALWAWAVTTAVVAEALVHARAVAALPTRRIPGVPGAIRRFVLTACGVAILASAAGPAMAEGVSLPAPMAQRLAEAFDALPLGGFAPEAAAPSVPAAGAHPPATRVVRPGDSLWAIAADRLGAGASGASIAAEWHRIYAANRAAIGDQPGLIRPGQRLVLPAGQRDE